MAIQVPPDSTGKLVETNSPDGSTQRQVVTVGDKTTAANVLGITAGGAAKVDGSATTQPVSGSVSVSNFPATQPVSGTVTANAGTGTLAVSAASLPLPTLAATSTKQPALGVAGTASSDVLTVQGIAAMTALKVDNSGVTQPVSGTVTVQQSTAANLKVDLSGTAANATAIKVDNSAVTQPVSGTVTAQQATGTNLHAVVDSGTITTVSTVTAVTAITNALPTGTNTIGGVKTVPDSTSTFAATATDSTALEASHVIKASAGVLYGFSGYNSKTSDQFIQVFNSTTVPADATAPIILIIARAQSNFSWDSGKFGKVFATGIAVSNSTTAATKTIGAADCWFNFLYT